MASTRPRLHPPVARAELFTHTPNANKYGNEKEYHRDKDANTKDLDPPSGLLYERRSKADGRE
jgi:hypothetical protein